MKDATVSLRIPARMLATIEQRLEDGMTVSAYIRESLSERLRHASESNKSRFRELQVYGSKSGDDHDSAVDRRFDTLLHNNGMATDMAGGGGGEMDPDLASLAKKILTENQYRRLMPHLQDGHTMEQIAHDEGVAKQAVHTSIRTAKRRLLESKEFRGALAERAAGLAYEVGKPIVTGEFFSDGTIPFERMFEMVAGARAMSADVASSGRFHPNLGRAMRPILTKTQYKRLEMSLARSMSLRQIAEHEDCSYSSVRRAILLARRRLRSSVPVLKALCQTYTEQTGVEIDVDAMVSALTGEARHGKAKP